MNLEEILAAIQAGNFADLTDEQLTEGRQAIRDSLLAHKNGETVIEDAGELKTLVDAGKAAKAEFDGRTATAQAQADEVAEMDDLIAGLGDPEPAPAADPEPEPVKASVAEIAKRRPVQSAPEPEAVEDDAPAAVLVAAGGMAGDHEIPEGQKITSARELGARLHAVHEGTGATVGGARHRAFGMKWNTAVGALQMGADGDELNFAMLGKAQRAAQERARADIERGFSPQVIQAATGICGPTEPVYDVVSSTSATAGILDLPTLNLRRGRVSLPTALTYDDLRETIGIAYKYDSSDGDGTHGTVTKDCYSVQCGANQTFEVAGFQTCLTFSNFMGMFNPEYVAHVATESLAAHAHRVNRSLIADILAAGDTVTYDQSGDNGGGAIVQLSRAATFHSFLYRDKYRLDQSEVLEYVLPYRALGALVADGFARPNDTFAVAQAVSAIQSQANVRFQFVYDYTDMAASPGDFGDEDYEGFMFPAGSVIHIGAETLNLGEVRDSTLNALNEYRTWVETFDGIATTGREIMRTTGLILCPNGATGAAETIVCTDGATAS